MWFIVGEVDLGWRAATQSNYISHATFCPVYLYLLQSIYTFPCLANVIWPHINDSLLVLSLFGYYSKVCRRRCQLIFSDNKAKLSWSWAWQNRKNKVVGHPDGEKRTCKYERQRPALALGLFFAVLILTGPPCKFPKACDPQPF